MDFRKIENALEEERRRLMTQVQKIEGALYALATVRSGAAASKQSGKKTRTFSKTTRARMAASQRARWAKIRARKS